MIRSALPWFAPAMDDAPPQTILLPYALAQPRAARAWRVAFWFGVAYLMVLVILIALQVRPMLGMLDMLRVAPRFEPFVFAIVIVQTASPVLMLANTLAVAGYAVAARGRSPRRLFLIYIPVQLALWLMIIAAAIYGVANSPFTYSTPGASGTIYMSPIALALMPPALALCSLPLVALVLPSVRRACLGTGFRAGE